jgi:Glutamine amidotransferase domain
MCGVAGYAGVYDHGLRYRLVRALGGGIESRGKDAAGYVSVTGRDKKLRYARRLGPFSRAKNGWIVGAASGVNCMLHTRYATDGDRGIDGAHPFKIERNGKPVLYGAHNGGIWNAHERAREAGRHIAVDSQEIFERLADNDHDGIRSLQGYGTAQWIERDRPDQIFLLRLSEMSELAVAQLANGPTIWASTEQILKRAVNNVGQMIEKFYEVTVGAPVMIDAKGCWKTEITDLKVSSGVSRYWSGEGWGYDDESYVNPFACNRGYSTHSDQRGGYFKFGAKTGRPEWVEASGAIETDDEHEWEMYLRDLRREEREGLLTEEDLNVEKADDDDDDDDLESDELDECNFPRNWERWTPAQQHAWLNAIVSMSNKKAG